MDHAINHSLRFKTYFKWLFHTVNSHQKNIFRKLALIIITRQLNTQIRVGIIDIAENYI
jgi:hypothetical protein